MKSSVAKCFANEIVREVTASAMQVMGGYGYHKDYGMEQRLRDAFAWGIAGGSIDVQKTNIAAALVGRRFRSAPIGLPNSPLRGPESPCADIVYCASKALWTPPPLSAPLPNRLTTMVS